MRDLIDKHDFNSDWRGSRVGIIRHREFFDQDTKVILASLADWSWVEFRCDSYNVDRLRLAELGFFLADTQIHFRISLNAIKTTPSAASMSVSVLSSSSVLPPASDIVGFKFERYRHVPGVNAAALNERYARWAAQIIRASPETCLQVNSGGIPQGWFLSSPRESKLTLTLAMMAATARISGLHLYQVACAAYADRDFSIGEASFSVYNTPVLNIYSSLGARFTKTEDVWLWIGGTS